MKYEKTDLGLSYEEAAHGVQSSIAFEMETGQNNATEPKHLRVGIDMEKAEDVGIGRVANRQRYSYSRRVHGANAHRGKYRVGASRENA